MPTVESYIEHAGIVCWIADRPDLCRNVNDLGFDCWLERGEPESLRVILAEAGRGTFEEILRNAADALSRLVQVGQHPKSISIGLIKATDKAMLSLGSPLSCLVEIARYAERVEFVVYDE